MILILFYLDIVFFVGYVLFIKFDVDGVGFYYLGREQDVECFVRIFYNVDIDVVVVGVADAIGDFIIIGLGGVYINYSFFIDRDSCIFQIICLNIENRNLTL